MQDVIVKLVSVFVDKALLEIQICFVCHQLDHQLVLLDADQAVIVNMEPQINVFVILDTPETPTQGVRILNTKLVQISNAEIMLNAQWQLAYLNVYVKRVILETHTTNV